MERAASDRSNRCAVTQMPWQRHHAVTKRRHHERMSTSAMIPITAKEYAMKELPAPTSLVSQAFLMTSSTFLGIAPINPRLHEPARQPANSPEAGRVTTVWADHPDQSEPPGNCGQYDAS